MKKFWDWISTHRILTILFLILILFVQPFVVHLFLKLKAPSSFFIRDWNPGDLITYIAGFEAFIGTMFLGVVAVRQNDKANETSKKMQDNEEMRDAFERQPAIFIKNWVILPVIQNDELSIHCNTFSPRNSRLELYAIDEDTYQIIVELINVSKTHISLIVQKMEILDLGNPHLNIFFDRDFCDMCKSIFILASGQTESLSFLIDKSSLFNWGDKLCTLTVKLFNSIGEAYIEIIPFAINAFTHDPWLEVLSYNPRKI